MGTIRPVTIAGPDLVESHHRHVVQFYEDEHELVSSVVAHLGPALAVGDAAVVVATPAHADAFRAALTADGVDVAGAETAGRYISIDADAVLAAFLVDGWPDRTRFRETVGLVLDLASAGHRDVRVYGEMVAVLWAREQRDAAIRLEALWNELGQGRTFSLYCGYPMLDFGTAGLGDAKGVCDLHGEIMTPASYGADVPAPAPIDDTRSQFFVPVPLAARAVRRFVNETLAAWGQHALIDDAELVASELASNSYRHANSPFEVTLSRHDGGVRLAVSDASGGGPVRREASAEDAGGRGIAILAAVATRWGHEVAADGKIVWADLGPID